MQRQQRTPPENLSQSAIRNRDAEASNLELDLLFQRAKLDVKHGPHACALLRNADVIKLNAKIGYLAQKRDVIDTNRWRVGNADFLVENCLPSDRDTDFEADLVWKDI
ncbi:hypothetical protein MAR_018648 [Mya arenaria]|uniref:Uncharacterized protein n=1 Tax=Mya arenaria TaxID=6604 RepID=A0ABY7EF97_MYAAR|nr:hypothetical protein MAR_018648 [Mya arenaria]